MANHTHGERVNIDQLQRVVSSHSIDQMREYLSIRFPALAECPVVETRICQYENSANGDFVIDLHPGLSNVWLVGCGSGHGFQHGPAIGAHIAGLIKGSEKLNPRFSIESKKTV